MAVLREAGSFCGFEKILRVLRIFCEFCGNFVSVEKILLVLGKFCKHREGLTSFQKISQVLERFLRVLGGFCKRLDVLRAPESFSSAGGISCERLDVHCVAQHGLWYMQICGFPQIATGQPPPHRCVNTKLHISSINKHSKFETGEIRLANDSFFP